MQASSKGTIKREVLLQRIEPSQRGRYNE